MRIIKDMIIVSIIAALFSAILWITEWNQLVGYAYTFALIGITLEVARRTDR